MNVLYDLSNLSWFGQFQTLAQFEQQFVNKTNFTENTEVGIYA